jgi:hypothetical protein
MDEYYATLAETWLGFRVRAGDLLPGSPDLP